MQGRIYAQEKKNHYVAHYLTAVPQSVGVVDGRQGQRGAADTVWGQTVSEWGGVRKTGDGGERWPGAEGSSWDDE